MENVLLITFIRNEFSWESFTWLDIVKIHKILGFFWVSLDLRQIIFLVYLTYSPVYFFDCASMEYITIQKTAIWGSQSSFIYCPINAQIHKDMNSHTQKYELTYTNTPILINMIQAKTYIQKQTLVHIPTQTWT